MTGWAQALMIAYDQIRGIEEAEFAAAMIPKFEFKI